MRRIAVIAIALATTFAVSSAQAETKKLFVNLPLSGNWSSFGEGMYNAFELAIDQANQSGELGDLRLEVVRGDNAGDSAQAASLATKAGTDRDVIGAFCCWSAGLALATHSIYNRYGLPTVLGGSNDHRSTRPYHDSKVIFRNSPYDLINMKMLATFAVNYGGFERIYTIDDNTAFSVTQVNEFTNAAEKLGAKDKIIGRESVQIGERDFSPLITKIKALNPDAVFYAGHLVEASLFRRQATTLGLNVPMMSSGGVFSNTYIEMTGEPAEGTLASFWGAASRLLPRGPRRGIREGLCRQGLQRSVRILRADGLCDRAGLRPGREKGHGQG